jgi:hypothetical protein
MGERIAAELIPEKTVDHSVPGLKQRTDPPTAGRTPAARPPILQPESGRGVGQSPTVPSQREALVPPVPSDERAAFSLDAAPSEPLSEFEIQTLIQFFTTLDRWDREAHGTQTM